MQPPLPYLDETELPTDCHDFPEGWQYVQLGYILTQCQYGLSVASGSTIGTPMVGMKHLVEGRVVTEDCPLIDLDEQELATFLLKPGDLLFNRTNSFDLVGKTGLFLEQEDAVFASYLVRLCVRHDYCMPEFVNFCLNASHYQAQIKKLATKGVSQCNINPTQLRKRLMLPLPPLPEQARIVEILDASDAAVRATESLIEAKTRYKRALAEQLLTGKRRFREFARQEWQEVEIGSLLQEIERPVIWDDDEFYNLISVRRRSGGLFFRDKIQGKAILTKTLKEAHSGDFLISKMQVVHGAWGIVTEEFNGLHVSDSYISLVPRSENCLYPRFFNFLSQLPSMYRLALISSHGVHIEKMTFNLDLFLRSRIKLPSTVAEQQKIAEFLGLLDEEIALLRREKDALKIQKQGLMQKLLTGQVRVKEFAP